VSSVEELPEYAEVRAEIEAKKQALQADTEKNEPERE